MPPGFRAARGALFAALLLLVSACGPGHPNSRDFVGKWKSTRLETPIVLHDNGEWEIVDDEGKVKDYGVWQYLDGAIVWSFKEKSQFVHDTNPVLSATKDEFRIREQNGTTTIFTRLK